MQDLNRRLILGIALFVGAGTIASAQWRFELGRDEWGDPKPAADSIRSPRVDAVLGRAQMTSLYFSSGSCKARILGATAPLRVGGTWHTGSNGGAKIISILVDGAAVSGDRPTLDIVLMARKHIGVAVQFSDGATAAFRWPVRQEDREMIRHRLPHCLTEQGR